MKKHYNYRITNIIKNKHYYGTRSALAPHIDLGIKYFSSSTDKEFIKDQKENPQNYKYKVVYIHLTRVNALKYEIKLHNKFNVTINENFYNKVKQTSTGFDRTGLLSPNKGKQLSDEQKRHLSHINKGKKLSKETKEKISFSQKGKITSVKTKHKMSISQKGKKLSSEHINKLKGNKNMLGKKHSEKTKHKMSVLQKGDKNAMFNKNHSEETKEKMSKSSLGKTWKQKKVECPQCGKIGGLSNMKVHHFDNCKNKKVEVNSSNSYNTLKAVIIGNELKLNKRILDFTFKNFYKSNLGQSVYEYNDLGDEYIINEKILNERIEDLDNLAYTLRQLGITVYRPDVLDKVIPFKTTTYKSELSPANNVRDITIVIDDKLIETPIIVRNRAYENLAMYNTFKEVTNNFKTQWIKAPLTILTEDSVDLDNWKEERDFNDIPDNYEAAIDGANFLRLNDDIIVNISNYNQYLGFLWLKSFFLNKKFHIVKLCDSHIDGVLASLNENTFLVNPNYPKVWEKLPYKFHPDNGYIYLYPKNTPERETKYLTDKNLRLASDEGMSVNILSISKDTVIVQDDAIGTIKVLEENGFKIIPVQLRHSHIFAGSLHCSSLDIQRLKK